MCSSVLLRNIWNKPKRKVQSLTSYIYLQYAHIFRLDSLSQFA